MTEDRHCEKTARMEEWRDVALELCSLAAKVAVRRNQHDGVPRCGQCGGDAHHWGAGLDGIDHDEECELMFAVRACRDLDGRDRCVACNRRMRVRFGKTRCGREDNSPKCYRQRINAQKKESDVRRNRLSGAARRKSAARKKVAAQRMAEEDHGANATHEINQALRRSGLHFSQGNIKGVKNG